MDLDSLGPIVLFIVYMAISAWSKQNKARQRNKPSDIPVPDPQPEGPRPIQKKVGGILEQIKSELAELYEEPEAFQPPAPAFETEVDVEIPTYQPEAEIRFTEGGSEGDIHTPKVSIMVELEDESGEGQSLDEVLEPYSKIEQGILLHELLGKPRALQNNDDWFHKS